MRRIILGIFLLLCRGVMFGNPLMEHIDITEFQFTQNGWQIELFSDFFGSENLDQCSLTCSDGSSDFIAGTSYIGFDYLVVSQEDLVTPLTIAPNEDEVSLQYAIGEGSSFNFGTLNDMVLSPNENQSLRRIGLSNNGFETTDIVFAKDNTPSMGTQDDGEGFTGTFCGYVFDSMMNPVANVVIEHTPDCVSLTDIVTDENGYFEVDRYAVNYDCNIHLGALASMDSIISIEPDSLNYYEFVFENYVHSDDHEIQLPSSFYELSNFPNPFNPSTTISFSLTTEVTEFTEGTEIQICNSRGQKVKQLISDQLSVGQHTVIWDGTNEIGKPCPSGVYLYKLVSGDKELAASKMLLLK